MGNMRMTLTPARLGDGYVYVVATEDGERQELCDTRPGDEIATALAAPGTGLLVFSGALVEVDTDAGKGKALFGWGVVRASKVTLLRYADGGPDTSSSEEEASPVTSAVPAEPVALFPRKR